MRVGLVIAALLLSTPARADTTSANLNLAAEVESSISISIESAGGALGGAGTAAATSTLGSVSRWGAAPTGFSIARGGASFTLSSTIGVKVIGTNLAEGEDAYLLTAELASTPAAGVTWRLRGQTLGDASPATIEEAGTFGSTVSYAWTIEIADSASSGPLDNTIEFTAISH